MVLRHWHSYAILAALLFLLGPFGLWGQSGRYSVKDRRAVRYYERGLSAYRAVDTALAFRELGRALEREPGFVEVYLLQAQIYQKYGAHGRVYWNYCQAFALDSTLFPVGYFHAANAAYRLGLYDAAASFLDDYKRYAPKRGGIDTLRLERLRADVAFSLRAVAHPVLEGVPEPVGGGVNSELDEYFPVLLLDGERLVFTRLLPNDPPSPTRRVLPLQEDLFISRVTEDAEDSVAQPLSGLINSYENEGASSLNGAADELIFTRCLGPCGLWVSRLGGEGEWGAPKRLPEPVNGFGVSVKQPSLSADGRWLFFSSNRPGGPGGYDVWYSERQAGGTWSKPHLADGINTPGDEQTPFLHPDGRTLYFSSEGYPGLGGLDLYVTRWQPDGTFSEPENLGYPINTYADDMGLSVSRDGAEGFFASNRGAGGLDIYRFPMPLSTRPESVFLVRIAFYDSLSGFPLMADYEVVGLTEGEVIWSDRADERGCGVVVLGPGEWGLYAMQKGYLPVSHRLLLNADSLGSKGIVDVRMGLSSVALERSVELRTVQFAFGSAELDSTSRVELDRWVTWLRANPAVSVRIEGHTDSVGAESYNQNLSERRARAVREYLVRRGVPGARVGWIGFGSRVPLTDNEDALGRARNRRTELRVVEREQ